MRTRTWLVAMMLSLSMANVASAITVVACRKDAAGRWVGCGPLVALAVTDANGDRLNVNGFNPLSAPRGDDGKRFGISNYSYQNSAFGLTMTLGTNIDPHVMYGLASTNFTSGALNFSFTFSSPYVAGPYALMTSSHSSSYTRTGGTATTIVPFGGTTIHRPYVDAVDITGAFIATSCAVNNTPPFSGACSYADVINLPNVTAASGMFGGKLGFTMPANTVDLTYTANGLVQLDFATVPEPGTMLLLAFGLIAVTALALQRRRAS